MVGGGGEGGESGSAVHGDVEGVDGASGDGEELMVWVIVVVMMLLGVDKGRMLMIVMIVSMGRN